MGVNNSGSPRKRSSINRRLEGNVVGGGGSTSKLVLGPRLPDRGETVERARPFCREKEAR